MANKRLSEDEIKYTVSAETAKAQQEIYNLSKATKALKNEEKERRAAMVELEAQGKKNTDEYRNLEKEAKKLSQQISVNNKETQRLTQSMSVNDMTMTQLKKHAKDLERQLDNTAESANPKEYADLNRRLSEVRDRMKQLRTAGLEMNKQMDKSASAMDKMKMAAKAFIAVKVVGWLKSAHDQAYNTRKEFAKYEAVLRNTFQSQEKANEAMKMLQQLAADTPSSLQEWTEGYIKLVNRGLQPTSQELTNLGDLAASQGKSLDQLIEAVLDAMTGENERLKEFGIKASKEGEKTQFTFRGVTTEVQNSEEAIKDYLLSLGRLEGVSGSMAVQMNELEGIQSNLGDTMDAFFNKMGKRMEPFWKSAMKWANDFFSGLTKLIEPVSDTFDDQFNKVVKLQSTLPPLITKYEELKSKTSLTKDEQKELNEVVSQLSTIVPSAITQWDEYGRAIEVNTSKVREFLQTEIARLKYLHRDALEEAQQNLDNAKMNLEKYERYIKEGGKWEIDDKTGLRKFTLFSDEEKKEFDEKIKKYGDIVKGSEAQIRKWSGKEIEETVNDQIKANEQRAEAQRKFYALNKSMLSAWIKDEANAASQYMDLAKEIYNKRFPETGSNKKKEDDTQKKNTTDTKKPTFSILTNEELAAAELERQLSLETELYEKHQRELKELFISGNDENLQSQEAYQEAMEQLAIMHLERTLDIAGLSAEQQKQIEEQLLDFKMKCVQEELSEREQADKKRLQEEEQNAQKQQANYQKRVQTYQQYGQQVGDALGNIISGQEDAMQGFADTMLDIVFDVLGQVVQAEIIKATATATSAVARATAESYATPDSVLTFGASGSARAAVLSGLIMAALAAAKSALKGLINKSRTGEDSTTTSSGTTYNRVATGLQSGGKIDVVRAQDGKKFYADYDPNRRGYIDKPTVIVGEGPIGQSREWVASNAAVNNPTVAPILDIIDRSQQAGTIRTLDLNSIIKARLAGYSSGGKLEHPAVSNSQIYKNGNNDLEGSVISRLISAIERLERNGIPADVVLTDLERKQKLRDRSRKIGSK